MKWPATVIAALTAASCAVAACSASPSPARHASHRPAAGPAPVTAAGCLALRTNGPLPTWARSGFTPQDQPIGHVLGARGDIVAILWGGPLTSLYAPPRRDGGNKILWVSRLTDNPSQPFMIRATLNGTDRITNRELPYGPGPSLIDLPAPGCWTMSLRWSGHHDQVQVWYAA